MPSSPRPDSASDDVPPPDDRSAAANAGSESLGTDEMTPSRLFCHEPPTIEFAEVAGPRGEIVVLYNGNRYRLIATRKGGLLLNK